MGNTYPTCKDKGRSFLLLQSSPAVCNICLSTAFSYSRIVYRRHLIASHRIASPSMCFSIRPERDYYYTEEIIPARRSPPRYHHSHPRHRHHGHPARVSYSSVTRETYHGGSPRVSTHSHHRY